MILVIETAKGETKRFDLADLKRAAAVFDVELSTPKLDVTGTGDQERNHVECGPGDRVRLTVELWAMRVSIHG